MLTVTELDDIGRVHPCQWPKHCTVLSNILLCDLRIILSHLLTICQEFPRFLLGDATYARNDLEEDNCEPNIFKEATNLLDMAKADAFQYSEL